MTLTSTPAGDVQLSGRGGHARGGGGLAGGLPRQRCLSRGGGGSGEARTVIDHRMLLAYFLAHEEVENI